MKNLFVLFLRSRSLWTVIVVIKAAAACDPLAAPSCAGSPLAHSSEQAFSGSLSRAPRRNCVARKETHSIRNRSALWNISAELDGARSRLADEHRPEHAHPAGLLRGLSARAAMIIELPEDFSALLGEPVLSSSPLINRRMRRPQRPSRSNSRTALCGADYNLIR